jgi:hypothetical protein
MMDAGTRVRVVHLDDARTPPHRHTIDTECGWSTMSTKLSKKLVYDATAEAVAAMLDDVAFREEVLERQKVVRGSVDIDGDEVTIEQVRSADDLPSFARKLVGDEIVIVQKETWTSPTACDVALSIPGKPGEAVGTMELVELGGRTTETIDLDLSVRIPLVGGKIEALIAGLFSEALDIEEKVGREWLAR